MLTMVISLLLLSIGACIWVVERNFTKMLVKEDNEQLIPFPIHGSRVMLTSAEYAAHLDDQLDTANTWAAKLLRDTKD